MTISLKHEVASKPSIAKSDPLFSRPRFVHNRVLTWLHPIMGAPFSGEHFQNGRKPSGKHNRVRTSKTAAVSWTFRSLLTIIVVCLSSNRGVAAHTLAEPVSDERVFQVTGRLDVTGQLETASPGKAIAHDLKVDATLEYRERRLAGTGRDAEALRSLRHYETTHIKSTVSGQVTSRRLRDSVRLIVAQGERGGISPYSPSGPLRAVELESLQMSGDSLALLGLLPLKPVDVDEEWTCDSWVLQMLTGTEAVLKSELKCRLKSITDDAAKVEYQGTLEGASDGAETKVEVEGHYIYDVVHRHIRHFEMTEKQKKSLGTRPGVDAVAKIVVERILAKTDEPLTDEAVARIPFVPDETQMMLAFNLPWNAQLLHDRSWHLFQQSNQVAVLRLMERGSFIAQCNIVKNRTVAPGTHTPEERFQTDIKEALGEKLKEIASAERVKSDDDIYRYRVQVNGVSGELKMTWIYYLCAAPSGQQIAFVFSVGAEQLERLSNRDQSIIKSVTFLPPKVTPVKAEP